MINRNENIVTVSTPTIGLIRSSSPSSGKLINFNNNNTNGLVMRTTPIASSSTGRCLQQQHCSMTTEETRSLTGMVAKTRALFENNFTNGIMVNTSSSVRRSCNKSTYNLEHNTTVDSLHVDNNKPTIKQSVSANNVNNLFVCGSANINNNNNSKLKVMNSSSKNLNGNDSDKENSVNNKTIIYQGSSYLSQLKPNTKVASKLQINLNNEPIKFQPTFLKLRKFESNSNSTEMQLDTSLPIGAIEVTSFHQPNNNMSTIFVNNDLQKSQSTNKIVSLFSSYSASACSNNNTSELNTSSNENKPFNGLWSPSEQMSKELNIPTSVKQAKMCFETISMHSSSNTSINKYVNNSPLSTKTRTDLQISTNRHLNSSGNNTNNNNNDNNNNNKLAKLNHDPSLSHTHHQTLNVNISSKSAIFNQQQQQKTGRENEMKKFSKSNSGHSINIFGQSSNSSKQKSNLEYSNNKNDNNEDYFENRNEMVNSNNFLDSTPEIINLLSSSSTSSSSTRSSRASGTAALAYNINAAVSSLSTTLAAVNGTGNVYNQNSTGSSSCETTPRSSSNLNEKSNSCTSSTSSSCALAASSSLNSALESFNTESLDHKLKEVYNQDSGAEVISEIENESTPKLTNTCSNQNKSSSNIINKIKKLEKNINSTLNTKANRQSEDLCVIGSCSANNASEIVLPSQLSKSLQNNRTETKTCLLLASSSTSSASSTGSGSFVNSSPFLNQKNKLNNSHLDLVNITSCSQTIDCAIQSQSSPIRPQILTNNSMKYSPKFMQLLHKQLEYTENTINNFDLHNKHDQCAVDLDKEVTRNEKYLINYENHSPTPPSSSSSSSSSTAVTTAVAISIKPSLTSSSLMSKKQNQTKQSPAQIKSILRKAPSSSSLASSSSSTSNSLSSDEQRCDILETSIKQINININSNCNDANYNSQISQLPNTNESFNEETNTSPKLNVKNVKNFLKKIEKTNQICELEANSSNNSKEKDDDNPLRVDNSSCVLPSKFRQRSHSLADQKPLNSSNSKETTTNARGLSSSNSSNKISNGYASKNQNSNGRGFVKNSAGYLNGSSSNNLAKRANRNAATAREALIRWCRKMTEDYDNISIENFSSSWSNGLAFCALINHFMPECFDYSKLEPSNARYNFELAFKTAEDKAGIVSLLDVDDMIEMGNSPDWKCVFTYVHSIYQRFKDNT